MSKTKSKTKSIVPIGDRVTIREIPSEECTASGIILPPSARENARTRQRTGVVLRIGDGVTSKAIKVGDKVVVSEFAGMELTIDGDKQFLLTMAEIVARIDGSD